MVYLFNNTNGCIYKKHKPIIKQNLDIKRITLSSDGKFTIEILPVSKILNPGKYAIYAKNKNNKFVSIIEKNIKKNDPTKFIINEFDYFKKIDPYTKYYIYDIINKRKGNIYTFLKPKIPIDKQLEINNIRIEKDIIGIEGYYLNMKNIIPDGYYEVYLNNRFFSLEFNINIPPLKPTPPKWNLGNFKKQGSPVGEWQVYSKPSNIPQSRGPVYIYKK